MESAGGRTGTHVKRVSVEGAVLALILLVGCLVRLAALDKSPLGLHQDEAYSAYNAWSVMHYGVDSYGYVRPVYYTVWGSGMNVLYSWLTMPFLALMGTTVQAIRLPQAILGCLSIPAVWERKCLTHGQDCCLPGFLPSTHGIFSSPGLVWSRLWRCRVSCFPCTFYAGI